MPTWVEKMQGNLDAIVELIAMIRTSCHAAEARQRILMYAERNPGVIDEICRMGFVPAIHNAIVSRMSQMVAGHDGLAEEILNEIADRLAQHNNWKDEPVEEVRKAGRNLQAVLQRRKRERKLKSLGYGVEERQRQSELVQKARSAA